MASDWSAPPQPDPLMGIFDSGRVVVGDLSIARESVQTEWQQSSGVVTEEALTRNIKSESYPSFDSDDSRTVRINLPPQEILRANVPLQYATFGQSLSGLSLSTYADLEGDQILLTYRDAKNPFWNIHGVLVKTEFVDPITVYHYELQTDVIREGFNVASPGLYNIEITARDVSTGQAAPSTTIQVNIMGVGEYEHFMLTYVAPVKPEPGQAVANATNG